MHKKYRTKLIKRVVLLAPFAVSIASLPQSAIAQSGVPFCSSSSSDSDGDGWGWENNASCRIGASSNAASSGQSNTQVNASGFPSCSSNRFDPDGDGFGWENNQTCVVSNTGANASAPPPVAAAVAGQLFPNCGSAQSDPDGDGFGYENNRTCIVNNTNNGSQALAPPPVAAALPGSLFPNCSGAQADPDGDGFGYENNRTCVVTNAGNNAQASAAPPPPPVAAARPGNIGGRPVCLSDSTDVNNSGFGFENNRTCAVQPGVTATRNNPLFNRRICEDWFEIPYGNFRLQNNVWNAGAVFSNNWSQCITLTGNTSQPVASWDYNWLGRSEGNEFSVKSYPQVYYGRKTRFNQSGTVAETGLPAPLGSLPRFTIDFAYSETGNAERNVAFESFFHYDREAEDSNKQFEMMVWVGKPDTRTPGPMVTTARIDGRDWDVHLNPSLGWGYVAFVAQTPFTSGRLDWSAFIDWTRNSGPAFGVPAIVNSTWMGAIELGTETFWGAGTFTIDRLNITRR